ncbi:hypothetical protein EJ08DRAFT_647288 [Tothia fuscella]|uniref:Diaminohydroxyphosphoribosylamino-pyrimidine deaminase n=1 Tax=Tothia fuscella TaxID=1048955 RepID=A0A9P4NWH0_9PEZI|nr:hypothetical protein EJ08DRAFT_647288 [Tothia fuscella]
MDKLLQFLGEEITDPSEEAFLVFSQEIPSANLGFVDSKATTLEVSIVGKDISIRQSPSLLSSNRKEGTTGAVVWKITPLFAEWICGSDNALFRTGILDSTSHVLELGCGISGIVSLALAPKIHRYIATDQDYVLKLLRENIKENEHVFASASSFSKVGKKSRREAHDSNESSKIDTRSLDWETDAQSNLYNELNIQATSGEQIDLLIACDCIYNTHLIVPLVNTCAEICRSTPKSKPTLCIIAQQLRSAEVFEEWLSAFHYYFRVWRIPDELLSGGLKEGNGFVLHFGVLREDSQEK